MLVVVDENSSVHGRRSNAGQASEGVTAKNHIRAMFTDILGFVSEFSAPPEMPDDHRVRWQRW